MLVMLRHTLLTLLCLAATAPGPALPRADRLKVVATIPDLAELATAIGGERVSVQAICKGRENIHAVRLKPSHVVATSRADLFLQVGLSMEHAWVPGLLTTARNERVSPGGPGFVNTSEGWSALDVPERIDRSQAADIHPEGNPHINLDPRGGPHMARRILEALVRVDPDGEALYRANHAAWLERYEAAAARWGRVGAALRGRALVTYHTEFDYLLRGYGVELVATVEPKPGVPPTPGHLAQVIGLMREREVRVLVTAGWSNGKAVKEVARKTGARVLELPVMVGGSAAADSWIGLLDEVHRRLAEALGVAPEEGGEAGDGGEGPP